MDNTTVLWRDISPPRLGSRCASVAAFRSSVRRWLPPVQLLPRERQAEAKVAPSKLLDGRQVKMRDAASVVPMPLLPRIRAGRFSETSE